MIDFAGVNPFDIVKGGAPKDEAGKSLVDNKIDAITGATMTSRGLENAIDVWMATYAKYFLAEVEDSSDDVNANDDVNGDDAKEVKED